MNKIILCSLFAIVLCGHVTGAMECAALSNSVRTVEVPAGKAFKAYWRSNTSGNYKVSVTIEGNTFTFPFPSTDAYGPKIIPGPCTIKMETSVSDLGGGIYREGLTVFVYEVISNPSESQPATGVVIPADGTGNVRVVLESSADLVTWTEAQPGYYGRTEPKRFFRLRLINGTE